MPRRISATARTFVQAVARMIYSEFKIATAIATGLLFWVGLAQVTDIETPDALLFPEVIEEAGAEVRRWGLNSPLAAQIPQPLA